ncbi:MAG TPA: ATP-binding protein [Gemmatimonadales bacterium]|nr:ATP-binding protein [Gemmatimonadales bacterium]
MTRPRPGRGAGRPTRGAPARERAEQIQLATYRISEAAHTVPTLQELFRAIHGIVGELMPATNFYIALHDPARDVISFPYFVDDYDPPQPPKRPARGLTEYVLRTGVSLLADEEIHRELERRGEADLIGAPSIQWLGVPLKSAGATFGVLAIQTYTAGVRYAQAEKRVLEFVSTQIAMAIERKQAEVALRESEARLARAQEAAHLGSWELDLTNLDDVHQNPLWWSDEVYRIFGYVPGAVPVSTELLFRAVPSEDGERIRQAIARAVAEGVPYDIRHRVLRPDGTDRIVEERSTLVRDASGRPVRMVGTVLDVTERQRLEEQFLQSQKMEAVGRLAGGVAHDFNNLLTAIIGSADLLRERLGADHPERMEAEEIRQAAMRAADLTRQLLAFSRQQVLSLRVLDLNTIVLGMDKILHRVIGEDIEFRTLLAQDLDPVQADPGQLEQVLMNLAVNARDAMPRGGKLTIETTNATCDAGYADAHAPITPGRYVVLAVTDTGTGMDERTKAHVFEPFFTTKGKGKGTGLGLSTVYGIVKQFGGFVWVYSEPGHGSVFKIYLPRVDGPPAAAHREPWAAVAPRGVETVLVVEDQAEVRRLSQKVLEGRGYRVLVADHGTDALRLAQAYGGPIDILVTDVVMPGMSGREVGLALTARRPGLKVLYVSGYADQSIVHHGVLEPGLAFLQKPFTADALARKVREVLDTTPASASA